MPGQSLRCKCHATSCFTGRFLHCVCISILCCVMPGKSVFSHLKITPDPLKFLYIMDVYRPLRAGLFFYECLRLFLLVVFIYAASMGDGLNPREFPFLVYLSANALFPMMALFLWLRPDEYRSYLNLYVAGKTIVLVTFYIWQVFTAREGFGVKNSAFTVFFLLGGVIVSLADMLSLWGAWTLKNKFQRLLSRPQSGSENGGLQ